MTEAPAINPEVVRHTALADLYSLVAYLMQTPTAESIADLQGASPAGDVREIASELGLEAAPVEALCARLDALHGALAGDAEALSWVRIEHTRVFTQPHRPVVWPYEGVFLDDERVLAGLPSTEARVFINPAAGDAERAYRAAGFKVDGVREPADYIVTELEFAAKLHTLIAKALLEGDANGAAAFAEKLDTFKAKHLDAWVPRFFLRVREACAHEYYLTAADAGTLLCAADNLEDRAPAAQ